MEFPVYGVHLCQARFESAAKVNEYFSYFECSIEIKT